MHYALHVCMCVCNVGTDHDSFALAVGAGRTRSEPNAVRRRHAFALTSYPMLLRNVGEYLTNSVGKSPSGPSLQSLSPFSF